MGWGGGGGNRQGGSGWVEGLGKRFGKASVCLTDIWHSVENSFLTLQLEWAVNRTKCELQTELIN